MIEVMCEPDLASILRMVHIWAKHIHQWPNLTVLVGWEFFHVMLKPGKTPENDHFDQATGLRDAYSRRTMRQGK